MASNKVYFKNLDSIRFIAAALVYVEHGISQSYQYLPIQNTIWERLLKMTQYGAFDVSIFFVISGFLITFLLFNEYEMNSKIALRNFYIRRALRTWPLYFAVLVFSFLIYPLFASFIGINIQHASNVFYHLAFLSNFDVLHLFENNLGMTNPLSLNVTWSISVEEQFYLFWPLIFVFLPKRFWIHSIIVVIFGSLLFRIINYNNTWVLYFHSISVVLDLAVGALMAYLIKKSSRVNSFFENCSTYTHLILFIILFCLIFWSKPLFAFKYGEALSTFFISISVALIITAQAITQSTSILNLQNIKFANKWGKYTYGIYVLHPIVLIFMSLLVPLSPFATNNFAFTFSFGIIGFVLTLFFSKLSYKYFESRFLVFKKRFTTVETHP